MSLVSSRSLYSTSISISQVRLTAILCPFSPEREFSKYYYAILVNSALLCQQNYCRGAGVRRPYVYPLIQLYHCIDPGQILRDATHA